IMTTGMTWATDGARIRKAGRHPAAWLSRLALAALATLLTGTGVASAQSAGNRLEDIQVQALPGNRIELRLVNSSAASEPLAFTIENPARIAFDLQGTSIGLKSRRQDVKIGPLDTILAAESEGRTRVVLNLDTMVPYETR